MARPIQFVPARIFHLGKVLVFSTSARPARFVITGGLAGFTQLVLLKILMDRGWDGFIANAVAFILAAQFNFVLSTMFTWRDRLQGQALGRRWLIFHASIATIAMVNMAVFAVARLMLPDLAASALGICVAAVGNFFLGDRLVFRRPVPVTQFDDEQQREPAA